MTRTPSQVQSELELCFRSRLVLSQGFQNSTGAMRLAFAERLKSAVLEEMRLTKELRDSTAPAHPNP